MDMDRTCLHFHGACFVCLTLYTDMLSVLYLLYSICSLLYSNCTTATGIKPNRSQINMYVKRQNLHSINRLGSCFL
jgi:uncharacterized membrane protein